VLAIGGLLVCVALLTLAAIARVVRSSNPPRWTTNRVGEIISLAIAGSLPLGLACLGAGLIGAVQTGPDYLDLGLLAGLDCHLARAERPHPTKGVRD
jgi:hypothetical protein